MILIGCVKFGQLNELTNKQLADMEDAELFASFIQSRKHSSADISSHAPQADVSPLVVRGKRKFFVVKVAEKQQKVTKTLFV